jgi:hypothetical protein
MLCLYLTMESRGWITLGEGIPKNKKLFVSHSSTNKNCYNYVLHLPNLNLEPHNCTYKFLVVIVFFIYKKNSMYNTIIIG